MPTAPPQAYGEPLPPAPLAARALHCLAPARLRQAPAPTCSTLSKAPFCSRSAGSLSLAAAAPTTSTYCATAYACRGRCGVGEAPRELQRRAA